MTTNVIRNKNILSQTICQNRHQPIFCIPGRTRTYNFSSNYGYLGRNQARLRRHFVWEVGFEPTDYRDSKSRKFNHLHCSQFYWAGGRIRTDEGLASDGLQGRCNQPLCDSSKKKYVKEQYKNKTQFSPSMWKVGNPLSYWPSSISRDSHSRLGDILILHVITTFDF